jgi:Domain of unknown function (DUF4388)
MDSNVTEDQASAVNPTPGRAVLVFAEDEAAGSTLGRLLENGLDCRIHRVSKLDEAMRIYSTVWLQLVVVAVSDRKRGVEHLDAFVGSGRARSVPIMVSVCSARGGDHLDFLRDGADDAVPFLCAEPEILARAGRLIARESPHEKQGMTRRYTLAGDLGRTGLADLVTLLEHGVLTGSLELITRRGPGQILVRQGQVTHASLANLGGRVAFFELLREREGQFEFVPDDDVAGDKRCALEGPNASLLLEGSRANDENPYQVSTTAGSRDRVGIEKVSRALPPDRDLAEMWLGVLNQPDPRGEIRMMSRDRVREWTQRESDGSRLRLTLVTDVQCGLRVIGQFAAPVAQDEIVRAIQRPPAALGLEWRGPGGRTLEILLLDQQRLGSIADSVRCSPAVLILAPSYGDFMTYSVTTRTVLGSLVERIAPLMILGVGNASLEGQLKSFAKLARMRPSIGFLQGSLWKLEISPRALLEEAIRQWADVRGEPRQRVA